MGQKLTRQPQKNAVVFKPTERSHEQLHHTFTLVDGGDDLTPVFKTNAPTTERSHEPVDHTLTLVDGGEDLTLFLKPDALTSEKCYNPDDHTLTLVDGEDDMDFLFTGYSSRRAQMSCGHTVTPMSLTDWCQHQLDQGATKFTCGQTNCDAVWSYEEVCKMALLTPDEKKSFENKVYTNAAKHKLNVKSCPGCKRCVIRDDPNNLCVKCPKCTTDKNKPYKFCWQCMREWRGPIPASDRCDNDNCCNEQLQTLKNCPDIKFKDGELKWVKSCPSIRACPTCGKLLEHNTLGCKQILCARCKKSFCFVCLKDSRVCYELCNGYYKLCIGGVAPRQTSIPVWADCKQQG